MAIEYLRLSRTEFSLCLPYAVEVFITAMGYPPGSRQYFIEAWRRDTLRPGFHAFCAYDDHGIAGICYGFISTPDHWWNKEIQRGLAENYASAAILEQYRTFFEFAELHVHPRVQGQGVGHFLAEALISATSQHQILLSTPEVAAEDNRAFRLYRSLGFFDVLRNFLFAHDDRPFAVLGYKQTGADIGTLPTS
ncbi:MAG: GNAT family N-acetyltransferase [Corynebacterium sp.]|nr:GNAT family N-acetyltransferase [Corynebacterium sp.]